MNNEKLKKIMKELVDNHQPIDAGDEGLYYTTKSARIKIAVEESRKTVNMVIFKEGCDFWEHISFDDDNEWYEYAAKIGKQLTNMQDKSLDQILKDITTPTEVPSDFDSVQNDIINGKEED